MVIAILLLIAAALLILTGTVGWMRIEDYLARRRRAPTEAAMDGALAPIAADLAAHPDAALLERIRFQRLLIEIDRETERYRDGQDIGQGAPKERP